MAAVLRYLKIFNNLLHDIELKLNKNIHPNSLKRGESIMSASMPILVFEPILKSIVWGGRNLSTYLHRHLPTDGPYGESWELCDLDGNQSVVKDGAWAGKTIEQLLVNHKEELLGNAALLDGRFPLLFKFIDAQSTLSVQVHPDEQVCRQMEGIPRPKTEAWYIIDCTPNAKLYVGLAPHVTREIFQAALHNGSVADYLNHMSVKAGDYIFLPSGTIHAIGEGILLAEVQQSSNTTYRVFDWNRVGLDGMPRQLHVQEAMASIHFNEYGEPTASRPKSGRNGILCSYFSMETVDFTTERSAIFSSQGPIIVMCTSGQGSVQITANNSKRSIDLGRTAVVPAIQAANVKIESTPGVQCVVTQIP